MEDDNKNLRPWILVWGAQFGRFMDPWNDHVSKYLYREKLNKESQSCRKKEKNQWPNNGNCETFRRQTSVRQDCFRSELKTKKLVFVIKKNIKICYVSEDIYWLKRILESQFELVNHLVNHWISKISSFSFSLAYIPEWCMKRASKRKIAKIRNETTE